MSLIDGYAPSTKGVHAGGDIDPAEGWAGGDVTPGAVLVGSATDGSVGEAGAGATNVLGYALENQGPGKQFRDDIATGERVRYNTRKGARFMGIVKATSAPLVYGDYLKSAAGGELEKWDSAADAVTKICAKYVEKADFTPGASAERKVCEFGGV